MSETPTPLPTAADPAGIAIPRLIEQHGDKLFSLALRFCGNRHDAEDLVQETFLSAWRNWDSFRGESSPGTWLYTIAARACQRMQRKPAGAPASVASLDAMPVEGPVADLAGRDTSGDTPLDAELRREARQAVESAIATLPDTFRLPLVLKDLVGLQLKEIAAILGVPEATVKTRVHRARMTVRAAMETRLPTRDMPAPAFDRQVCLDLLHAKMEALDRGEVFSLVQARACDRCSAVFASLDLAKDVCREIAMDRIPDALRESLRRPPADASEAQAPRP
ncbi:MAG: RNA polymerase sigma factor [Planctomycetota bacterium]